MKRVIEIKLPEGRERFKVLEAMRTENLLSNVSDLLFNKKLYGELKTKEDMKTNDKLKSCTINMNNTKFRIDEINLDFGKAEAVISFNEKNIDMVYDCDLVPRVVKQGNDYKLITLDMVSNKEKEEVV